MRGLDGARPGAKAPVLPPKCKSNDSGKGKGKCKCNGKCKGESKFLMGRG
jgi:hypothetical protein